MGSQPGCQSQHPCPALPAGVVLTGENHTFLVKSSQSDFVQKGLCLYHMISYFSSWVEGFLGLEVGLSWCGQLSRDALAAWFCSFKQMSLQLFHSPRKVNWWVWLQIHLADLVFGESGKPGTAPKAPLRKGRRSWRPFPRGGTLPHEEGILCVQGGGCSLVLRMQETAS